MTEADLLRRIAELEGSISCIWCAESFGTVDVHDRQAIAEHALTCKENPLVQRIKELEARFS